MRLAGMMFGLLGAVPLGAAVPPDGHVPVYLVRQVEATIADDERVGARRIGLLCVPGGKTLLWKTIAVDGEEKEREIVRGALEDAGLRVASYLRGGETVVTGVIDTAGFALCERIPGSGALSGDAAMEVTWRIEAADDNAPPSRWASRIRLHLDKAEAASPGAIYGRLLGEAANDLARHLTAPQP